METDEKGNPLTYWGGLEKYIKITLEEAIENKIKGEIVDTGFKIKRSYSEEEVIQLVSDWTDYRMSEDTKSKVTFKKWFAQNKKK
jgi:hypothetical protein